MGFLFIYLKLSALWNMVYAYFVNNSTKQRPVPVWEELQKCSAQRHNNQFYLLDHFDCAISHANLSSGLKFQLPDNNIYKLWVVKIA